MTDLREALARLLQAAERQAIDEAILLPFCSCPQWPNHRLECPHSRESIAQRVRERQAEKVAEALPTTIEWSAILDALLFTEENAGLLSDAHIRVKPKVAALAAGQAHLQESPK